MVRIPSQLNIGIRIIVGIEIRYTRGLCPEFAKIEPKDHSSVYGNEVEGSSLSLFLISQGTEDQDGDVTNELNKLEEWHFFLVIHICYKHYFPRIN